ncbi:MULTISPECIES: MBL fold metallo-hydrolase RNA specificity domain-containing protein [Sphingobacterium]|uniref:MBL fold metallo-hydrolase RNA specificity domain-containing protein n=1 Tax=Sphingobacterium tenebrionis TaxID=3111775 RepID=A0ABU8I690_9SPHI|nr:MBL fold metallo-hydrolase RNA specificity domain-containing protein [Sphingobacterium sp. CZ-2]QBR11885.1 exonuclease [Sphingobacterium sp. CZ-2]
MNIIEDFLVRKEQGFYCSYGDFYIDPLYPVKHAVVSHAHGDHASPGHKHIYCTQATAEFIKLRHSKQPDQSFQLIPFDTYFEINGVGIYLYPAGHILGSAQILMVYKGVRYLYTGDYKLQADPTCEPIQFKEADVLITETTFANPAVKHPDPVQEIMKLAVPHNILLGCYSLGKAQRITALLNEHCPEKEVLVHHSMLGMHKIYDRYLKAPMRYELYNRKSMKDGSQNKIYLVPPLTFNSYRRARNVLKAFASGWERLQAQNDISLYLSDHVDWNDILYFIEQVKPKAIWTIHGDGRVLQQHFHGKFEIRDILSQTFSPDYC